MKTLKTAIITLLTLAAISCTGDKAPAIPERIVEDVDTETGVISLRDYSISDTIAIGGKIFNDLCPSEVCGYKKTLVVSSDFKSPI